MHNKGHSLTRRALLAGSLSCLPLVLGACQGVGSDPDGPERTGGEPHLRSLEEIRALDTIRVGIASDNKPLAYLTEYGNYAGLDHYFFLYFTHLTGIEVEYVFLDQSERYDALVAGAVDVCVAEMSPSDERAAEAAFCRPYCQLKLGLVSPNEAKIEKLDQLADQELIVVEGSYAHQYARKELASSHLLTYQSMSEADTALREGRAAALLADDIILAAWYKTSKLYTRSIGSIGKARMVGPAVAAGQDELCDQMDYAVYRFINADENEVAYKRYVKGKVSGNWKHILTENPAEE